MPVQLPSVLGLFTVAIVLVGCGGGSAEAPAITEADLPAAVRQVMAKEPYRVARWGMHVARLDGGEVAYSLAAGDLAASGSTGKLSSVGTWLDVFGPDYTGLPGWRPLRWGPRRRPGPGRLG